LRPNRGALAALLIAAPLSAHDFWIEPSTFRPAVGTTVSVGLRVGVNFHGDPVPRNPAMIVMFDCVSASGERPVVGRSGDEPAGRVRIDAPGLALIGYRSRNTPLSLEASKFEEYLREEGLENIIAVRAKRGDSAKPSRELFSRSAKALLSTPGGPATGYDRSLGLQLELIPEKDPYALAPGAELPVRLVYAGKPLSGVLVAALPREAPESKVEGRTDRQGRVRLRLASGGVWLVKAVHMVAAANPAEAEWESLWASLTFEIPAASPVGKAP
jgi:hypothetical protein